MTFIKIAGVKPNQDVEYDGECMFEAISGKTQQKRSKPLMWIRPPDRPEYAPDNDPDLAIRKGDYKLLMDFDGSNVQLYNLAKDIGETNNLVDKEYQQVKKLKKELEDWINNYPHDIDLEKYSYELLN